MKTANKDIKINVLILREETNGKYNVYYAFNNKKLGSFLRDIDGSFYFKIDSQLGYWSASTLRNIADALDLINKP